MKMYYFKTCYYMSFVFSERAGFDDWRRRPRFP